MRLGSRADPPGDLIYFAARRSLVAVLRESTRLSSAFDAAWLKCASDGNFFGSSESYGHRCAETPVGHLRQGNSAGLTRCDGLKTEIRHEGVRRDLNQRGCFEYHGIIVRRAWEMLAKSIARRFFDRVHGTSDSKTYCKTITYELMAGEIEIRPESAGKSRFSIEKCGIARRFVSRTDRQVFRGSAL